MWGAKIDFDVHESMEIYDLNVICVIETDSIKKAGNLIKWPKSVGSDSYPVLNGYEADLLLDSQREVKKKRKKSSLGSFSRGEPEKAEPFSRFSSFWQGSPALSFLQTNSPLLPLSLSREPGKTEPEPLALAPVRELRARPKPVRSQVGSNPFGEPSRRPIFVRSRLLVQTRRLQLPSDPSQAEPKLPTLAPPSADPSLTNLALAESNIDIRSACKLQSEVSPILAEQTHLSKVCKSSFSLACCRFS
ncbi:hypothetical protein KFK09_010455 [Dendrobium nobile]|uniref:Uncharacterized protein n=1 Tax=Dendrobium nobile TaxID=94219 RepID=A0A8T3BFP3_DENNO|nr:hypothetical protein KFK09_010455 [Dendrobium nobile]